MNTIFLVKKNPNLPTSKDNWINMEYEEFKCFLDSKEGTQRRKSFFYLLPADKDDYGIVIECGEEYAHIWMKEQNRSNYINRTLIETGYKLISYNNTIKKSDGTYTFDDVISAAMETSIEDTAMLSMQIKTLYSAINRLTKEEFELMNALYFSDTILPESTIAEQMSLPRTSFQYVKSRLLEKLKSIMLANTYGQ